MSAEHPIDETPEPPPQTHVDHDTLTRDILGAIEQAMLARVDRIAKQRGIGRRAAAVIFLAQLRVEVP